MITRTIHSVAHAPPKMSKIVAAHPPLAAPLRALELIAA